MKNKNIKTSIVLSVLLAMVSCKSDRLTRDLELNIRNLTEQNQSLTVMVPRGDTTVVVVDARDTINYVWKKPVLRGSKSFEFFVGKNTVRGGYIQHGFIRRGTEPMWLTIREDTLILEYSGFGF